MNRFFAILFICTGIFAISGGLYTWGAGSIFEQNELIKVLIPWADIIVTGPLSIIAGVGILKKHNWGHIAGLLTSGIYIFGSSLVYICIFWNKNYDIYLIIPAFAGLCTGLGYTLFSIRKTENASFTEIK